MSSRTIALISLYHPAEEHAENAKRIAEQADHVYLCDNSDTDNASMFEGIANATYRANFQNLGLSKAFNTILKDPAYGWDDHDILIFFDQDSRIEEGHISNLRDEYEALKVQHPIGCIGPVFFNEANGTVEVPRLKTPINEKSSSVNNIITSSMMTCYQDLKCVGFFNEELFLDLVDWDLCWRFRQKGYLCVITEKVVLNHCVGSGEKKFGPLKVRVGAPIREYYQTRDALYEIRRSYVPIKMRIRLIANVTVRPVLHLAALDDKKKRARYILDGYKGFFRKEHGEYHSKNAK